MSKVLSTKDRKILSETGVRVDKAIHQRRRQRDLILKKVRYARGINK